jgi:hypothetical protein
VPFILPETHLFLDENTTTKMLVVQVPLLENKNIYSERLIETHGNKAEKE